MFFPTLEERERKKRQRDFRREAFEFIFGLWVSSYSPRAARARGAAGRESQLSRQYGTRIRKAPTWDALNVIDSNSIHRLVVSFSAPVLVEFNDVG